MIKAVFADNKPADKRVISYAYDGVGQLKTLTNAKGQKVTFFYDDAHRLVKTVHLNDKNNFETIEYDTASNITAKKVIQLTSSGERTIFSKEKTYDSLNRLKSILVGGTTKRSYDYEVLNKPTTILDSLGNAAYREHNALGQVVAATDKNGHITTYQYAANGQVSQTTDPLGRTTSFEYDGFGQLVKKTSPDTGITTYRYDTAGNLIETTDAKGQTITRRYDAMNRFISDSTGAYSRYNFDKMSENGNAKVKFYYDYNVHGELIQKYQVRWERRTRRSFGRTRTYWARIPYNTTKYNYSPTGKVSSITHPNGMVVSYEFDDLDRVNAVLVNGAYIANNVSYYPTGVLRSISYANGTKRDFEYDGEYRLTGKKTVGISELSFGYDHNDNITSINNRRYSYDLKNQLTTADGASYAYDGIGNRISAAYEYNNGRVIKADGLAISYDLNGNMLSKGDHRYTWDEKNRLATFSQSGSQRQTDFTYSPDALMFSKAVKQGDSPIYESFYFYDQGNRLLQENNEYQSFEQFQNYVYFGKLLIAVVKNRQVYYVYNDHLSRPEKIVDSAKNVVWSASNTAFGRTISYTNGTLTVNHGFPGQYFESESGLYYNWNRFYDSSLGRYISSDPMGLYDGPNTYNYVQNNPINSYDPNGLWLMQVGGFAFGFASTLIVDRTINPNGSWAASIGRATIGGLIGAVGNWSSMGFIAREATSKTEAAILGAAAGFKTGAPAGVLGAMNEVLFGDDEGKDWREDSRKIEDHFHVSDPENEHKYYEACPAGK